MLCLLPANPFTTKRTALICGERCVSDAGLLLLVLVTVLGSVAMLLFLAFHMAGMKENREIFM